MPPYERDNSPLTTDFRLHDPFNDGLPCGASNLLADMGNVVRAAPNLYPESLQDAARIVLEITTIKVSPFGLPHFFDT
jgi:hypothetical protein